MSQAFAFGEGTGGGTVNYGLMNELAWYPTNGSAVSGLTTADNSILITDGSGAPSWSTTLPAFITSSITFNPTTGGIVGTTTNDNAAAGYVGEYISSFIPPSSAVSLVTDVSTNITSISLTAGDWDVSGLTSTVFSTAGTAGLAGTSLVSASLATYYIGGFQLQPTSTISYASTPAPLQRVSIAITTTVYLVGRANFASGTALCCGFISARRVR